MAETLHAKIMRIHTPGGSQGDDQPELVSCEVALIGKKQIAEGVQEEDIRAAEFAGFTPDHGAGTGGSTSRSRLAVIVVALAISVMAILHVLAATSLLQAGTHGVGLLKNPTVDVLAALAVGIAVIFKLRLASRLKHGAYKSRRKGPGIWN